MAKKTKRKIAHPMLPMQRQLNLRHEGKYFDLRKIFDRLNERHFGGRLRGYKVMWGRRRRHRPKGLFCFWNNPGTRPGDSNQSTARSAVRAALVSSIRALSRNASLGCPGRKLGRRRRVHTEEFNRREREFPRLPARRRGVGKNENLARFLR